MVLCLGEFPGGFCDVGCCCCFPYWRFLVFRTTFPCHQHSTPASQAREGLHRLWGLPWLLSVALLLPGFSATVLPRALRFWGNIFYPQTFFTLRYFTDIFGTFLWLRCRQDWNSDAGRNTPSRILLSTYPHRVDPSGWRMDLNYSYCSYKTIDLSIAPVSHEV